MSLKFIKQQYLIDISSQEQELINGGSQPQINKNNYTQKNANTAQTNKTDKFGNISQSQTDFTDLNTTSTSVLSSDVIGDNQSNGINTLTVIPPVAS